MPAPCAPRTRFVVTCGGRWTAKECRASPGPKGGSPTSPAPRPPPSGWPSTPPGSRPRRSRPTPTRRRPTPAASPSRRRGTAITSVLPCARARRRAWVCGESGLALIVSASTQAGCLASRSAAALAPAKLGIRPSAPGKRDTPSRSIDRHMSRRTSSLVRMGRASWQTGPMAESARTTLSQREQPVPEALPAAELQALRDGDLRDLLPAVETERRLTDWGRSERVDGLMDRTLVEFFYRYWFRAEVEGVENVPAAGGALIVSNHSGALPPDGAMIGKAIREEHTHPRPLNITVEHFFKGYPGFSMLLPKIGCVAAHPANVHRLLNDEGQLVLVFPEGRKGTEKLYKDRYRLRRFGRGGFVEAAMRARAPLVPVCVVGAEEAAPVFAQLNLLKRMTGLLYTPLTPTFPHLGLLGMLGYLPAKFKLRFLEPIRFDEEGMHEDKGLVQTTAQDIRARIQENLFEMVGERRSVWFG